MATGAWLATVLDQEMLESRGVFIAPRTTPDSSLRAKSGHEVWDELGGRLLVRYVSADALGEMTKGTSRPTYVTPTPYAASDLVSWLALPAPTKVREFALVIDPRKVRKICGPHWVRLGQGIEYLLPEGFPPGAAILRWEIRIA